MAKSKKIKKRIVLTGAQGTGKTTIMNEIKSKYGLKTLSIARKFASMFNWPNIECSLEDYQKALFSDMHKELSLKREGYVSDRGLTDVAAYTFSEVLNGNITKKFADNQYLKLQQFHQKNPDIIVAYFPIEFEIEDDGVRNIDKANQEQIDFLIKNILDTAGVNYITVTGTVEERLKQIEEVMHLE